MKIPEIVSLLLVVIFLALVGLGAWGCYRMGGWLLGIGGGIVLFLVFGTLTQWVFRLLNREARYSGDKCDRS